MKKSITSGLDDLQAKEITAEYQSSATLRKRLVELLEKKSELAYKERIKNTTYESPNWGFIQADGVGYERAIFEMIALISE